MIQLETYRGNKTRHTCPSCGSPKAFTRFINTETGEYLPESVGICNRASKCGYRYTAKEFFRDNPNIQFESRKSGLTYTTSFEIQKPKSFDYIPFEHLKATFTDYEQNTFVQFLMNLFPEDVEAVQNSLKMYFVGTFQDYTCFPQIDRQMRICKAKLIRFNQSTGKRLKGDFDTSSLVRKLKLKEDFQYKQIFFGEHLLPKFPDKTIAVVEAEKTAIIASLCFSEFVWLAIGSKQSLKVEKIKNLGKRKIILYPDADAFNPWQEVARDAQKQGLTVKVSSLIESHATDEQKANGYDLADYLIEQQAGINAYNAKLDAVFSDEISLRDFEMIVDERKAVMMAEGALSESEAETILKQPENLRRMVWAA